MAITDSGTYECIVFLNPKYYNVSGIEANKLDFRRDLKADSDVAALLCRGSSLQILGLAQESLDEA